MDSDKINLFKERTLGKRFSATAGFIRKNWKIIAKNLLYVGIPLALIFSVGMHIYMQAAYSITYTQSFTELFIAYGIVMFASLLLSLFISGITGAIMQKYQSDELNKKSGWPELGKTALRIMKNLFLQGLIFYFIFLVIALCIGIIAAFITPELDTEAPATIMLILTVTSIFFLIILILAPSLSLMVMPIIIENKSIEESIKKGFRLGFKYWGSTLITIFLGGIIYLVFFSIFSLPYSIYLGLSIALGGNANFIISLILMFLPSLILLFTTPVYIIFLGFQYCSVAKKEEEALH